MPSTPTRARALRGHAATASVVLLALALAGAAVAVFSGAYQVRPVLSSSMTPKLPVGSVVITQRVPVASVHAGDVIVFHDPYTPAKLVVHRVTTLKRADGVTTITTKGDANPVADPWTVTLRGDTSYRQIGVIPYVGRAAVWIHQPAIASHVMPIGLTMAGLAVTILLWPRRKPADDAGVVPGSAPQDARDAEPALGVASLFATEPVSAGAGQGAGPSALDASRGR